MKQSITLGIALLLSSLGLFAQKKPNILIIWGDDVGMWNLSAYHRGMMGGSTPNIDRIAKEGMLFMDHCRPGSFHYRAAPYTCRAGYCWFAGRSTGHGY